MVESQPRKLDAIYGALAHEVRRSMLENLRGTSARVTELAAPYDMSLAAASKHVRVLESAGLILRSVRGRDHHISLDPTPLVEAGAWIDSYRKFWEPRLDALEAHLREGDPR